MSKTKFFFIVLSSLRRVFLLGLPSFPACDWLNFNFSHKNQVLQLFWELQFFLDASRGRLILGASSPSPIIPAAGSAFAAGFQPMPKGGVS
jgi:hypothetical protein